MIASAFWSFIGQTSDPLSETDSASEIEPNTETLPLVNSKASETIVPKTPKRVKVKKALQREVLLIAPLLDVKEPPNVKKFNWVMEDGKMIKKTVKYKTCAVAQCRNVQGYPYFCIPSEKRNPEQQ